MSQKSHEHSNNAYDKHLLAKIGKPSSPPRHLSLGAGGDHPSPKSTTTLPFHGKEGGKPKSLSVSDVSVGSVDPVSRWVTSPPSAAASPGARPSWKDYIDYRSSSVDSSAPPSAIEHDQFPRVREGSRGSLAGSLRSYDELVSLPSHSARGSFDHGIPADHDTDFPMEETGGLRQLNIEERTPPSLEDSHSPPSKQGMKRRASSPPRDMVQDDRQSLHTVASHGDLSQPRAAGSTHARGSPNLRYHPNHGSVSSTSSAGMRNGSYASSAGLSVTGSSMTSFSSFDRHSPGGVSPISDYDPSQDSPYVTAITLNPNMHESTSRIRHHSSTPPESKSAATARKINVQSTIHGARQSPKVGGLYICECCPKKPKRFDSPENLR